MRLHSAKEGAEGDDLVINPELVDGATPHAVGTLLFLGAEELLVQESFDEVAEALESAWERRRRNPTLAALLEPLAPLAQVLPLLVPGLIAKMMPPAPEPPPAPRTHGEPVAPVGTTTPVEYAESGELITCRQCGKGAAAARLCPHCGAALVGEG